MSTAKSNIVTNFTAVPHVLNDTQDLGGRVRVAQGSIALGTADLSAADIVLLAPIPSNASIISIKLAADDLDSNGSPALLWDVGLYDANGTTAADADCYATNITLGQSATAFTEYRWEEANITTTSNKVWEDAGDSVDPVSFYYVSMTVDTAPATAAAGDVAFIIQYVVD
jgi:hypothetical protein